MTDRPGLIDRKKPDAEPADTRSRAGQNWPLNELQTFRPSSFMPEFTINTLTAVVEQLPVPVVLTTEHGEIVAVSHASHSLIGTPSAGDTMSAILRRTDPTPDTIEHRVEADGDPYVLVALDDRLRTPPADVAALARATAHDFNNLLGVIINFASLAAAQVAPGSNAAQDLQEVLVASRRAATLTQRLLQIAASAPDHETE